VTHVCAKLGFSRMCAYGNRAEDDAFREAWDAAVMLGIEKAEDECMSRAIGGADTLLMFILKAAKPDKYRERRETIAQMTHQGPGGQPLALQAVVNVQIGNGAADVDDLDAPGDGDNG
jgi:hypothetical protein